VEQRRCGIVADDQILAPDHTVAAAQGRLKLEPNGLFLAWAIQDLVPLETLQPFEAALGLAGALAGHVAPDIVFLLGNEFLLGAILL
jgi:hypothetical protein